MGKIIPVFCNYVHKKVFTCIQSTFFDRYVVCFVVSHVYIMSVMDELEPVVRINVAVSIHRLEALD